MDKLGAGPVFGSLIGLFTLIQVHVGVSGINGNHNPGSRKLRLLRIPVSDKAQVVGQNYIKMIE